MCMTLYDRDDSCSGRGTPPERAETLWLCEPGAAPDPNRRASADRTAPRRAFALALDLHGNLG